MEAIAAGRASARLYYNNVDVSADLRPWLISLEYNDFGSGQIDDLQVKLKDPDGRWTRSWYPESGARLSADIIWTEGRLRRKLRCGEFTIDAPEYESPGVMTLKGTAASITTSLRRTPYTKLWQNATLKSIAQSIASKQGITIVFDGADTPPISKVLQKSEADLAFLLNQCQSRGYALKVDSNRLVIYKLLDVDLRTSVVTFKKDESNLVSWKFSPDSVDTYSSAVVKYAHPDKGLITATYTPENPVENGQELTVRKHVDSVGEALALAQSELEYANRQRISCEMTIAGDTRLVSSLTAKLAGWGVYDGTYTIEKATHTLGQGYSTTLQMVRPIS